MLLTALPMFSYISESEVAQLCLTLWDPMCYSLPHSSIHGIFQARVLEWVVISFSRGSFQSRDQTWVSCIEGKNALAFKPPGKPKDILVPVARLFNTLRFWVFKYSLWHFTGILEEKTIRIFSIKLHLSVPYLYCISFHCLLTAPCSVVINLSW